jgi:osmotically-inducible protein OsmY
MQRDVQDRLHWDSLVGEGPIDVMVRAGAVSLSGVVESAAEKARAVRVSWVPGVTSVDASGLGVEPDAVGGRARAPESDAAIERAVRRALSYEPRLAGSRIAVEFRQGVVTLRGIVESVKARLAAESVAAHVVHVTAVKNDLRVRRRVDVPDTAIADRVQAALAIDPMLDGYDLEVRVERGHVRLDGTVDDFAASAEAEDVISGLSGVQRVENALKVSDSSRAYVYDVRLEPYAAYVSGFRIGPGSGAAARGNYPENSR